MPNERVDRLEERIAWLERHVTAQDKAMLELHEEIERLRRERGGAALARRTAGTGRR
jgi:SlyX protein